MEIDIVSISNDPGIPREARMYKPIRSEGALKLREGFDPGIIGTGAFNILRETGVIDLSNNNISLDSLRTKLNTAGFAERLEDGGLNLYLPHDYCPHVAKIDDVASALYGILDENCLIPVYGSDHDKVKTAIGCLMSGNNKGWNDFRQEYTAGIDLSGAILKGAQLSGIDFSRTTLTKADFSNASLRRSNFTNAFLRGTNFINAYLSNAIFTNADLDHTCFAEATLSDADLRGATFRCTSFDHAVLDGAQHDWLSDFQHAYYDYAVIPPILYSYFRHNLP